MFEYIASSLMPALVLVIFIFALVKKIDLYDAFVEGSKGGLATVLRIFPFLLAMIFAVNVLMSSGLIDFIAKGISLIFPSSDLQPELFSMAFLRPFSGAAGMAVLTNIYKTFTPDSFTGLTASIMMGSTDATFYILGMYFGSAGITKTRFALKAGLTADAIGLTSAILISYLIFR